MPWRVHLRGSKAMAELVHLIYNSVASSAEAAHEVHDILRVSRTNNAVNQVTGMLLFAEGSFFQVLEGTPAAVDETFARVAKDRRHTRVTTIIREPIARRSFSEWTMGLASLTAADIERESGLNDLFQDGKVLSAVDPGRARKLLEAFKNGRWRVRLSGAAAVPPSPPPPLAEHLAASTPKPGTVRPEFSFAFQPIVDGLAGRAIGYEALIRGRQREPAAAVLNRVPLPDVADFDEDARRVAVALAARLGLKGRLHLNVMPQAPGSALTSLDSTLEMAQRCGLAPNQLVLELKHEATIADPSTTAQWLQKYREQGVLVSIDDFGSGHAGLALLDHYQPDLISVSTWLVRDIESHGPRQAILRGLMQTCGDLGIDIVAKGVESHSEYSFLRAEGLTLFQGFLLAKPGFEELPRAMVPTDLD
jgi:EAL domain-containing protein (putative c-di-GMP-specific phosphodiesterase class I)